MPFEYFERSGRGPTHRVCPPRLEQAAPSERSHLERNPEPQKTSTYIFFLQRYFGVGEVFEMGKRTSVGKSMELFPFGGGEQE